MEDGEIVSFGQTYLLLLFYEPIDHSFPYLRRFPSLSLRYCVSYGNTSATSSRFSFLFQDYSILQIVNFRRENLSRDACSGIANRNIDNYGYNVSRIINYILNVAIIIL